MENTNSPQPETTPRKKTSFKRRALVIVLVIFLAAAIYGYFWYISTQKLRLEAQGVIEKADRYDLLSAEVQKERSRCENFISQKEGDFGSFEYCQKYIDWADTLAF